MVVKRSDQALANNLANQIKRKNLARRRCQSQRKITQKWVVKDLDTAIVCQSQRKITQKWVVKDLDTAIVYMTGARRGKRFARNTARNSNPTEGGDSDNTYEDHVTL